MNLERMQGSLSCFPTADSIGNDRAPEKGMISVHQAILPQDGNLCVDAGSDSSDFLDNKIDELEFEEGNDGDTYKKSEEGLGVGQYAAAKKGFGEGPISQNNINRKLTNPIISPPCIHPTASTVISKKMNPSSEMVSASTDLAALLSYQQEQLRQFSTIHSSIMRSPPSQPPIPPTRHGVGNHGAIKLSFNDSISPSVSSALHRRENASFTPSKFSSTSTSLSERVKISTQQSGKEPTFPAKLHKILSNAAFHDMISWLPHGRSWRVIKPKAFEEKVIPIYFRHARYASFMRQVNGWGFERITQGPDNNSYFHESFLRDFPGLSLKMRRLSRSNRSGSATNLYEKLHDVDLTAPLKIGGLDVDPIAFDPNTQMSRGLEPNPTYIMNPLTSPGCRISITSTSLPPRASGAAPSSTAFVNAAITSTSGSVAEEQGLFEQLEQITGLSTKQGRRLGTMPMKSICGDDVPSSDTNEANNDLVRKLNNIRRFTGMVPAGLPPTPNISSVGGGGFNNMPQQHMPQVGLGSLGELQTSSFSLSGMEGASEILPMNLSLQTDSLFGGNHQMLNH